MLHERNRSSRLGRIGGSRPMENFSKAQKKLSFSNGFCGLSLRLIVLFALAARVAGLQHLLIYAEKLITNVSVSLQLVNSCITNPLPLGDKPRSCGYLAR